MKKAALYARVSTLDQNPDMQLTELKRFCERKELFIEGEFIDRGISGAKNDRPALNQMMELCRKCKFDVVIVWKFDRFARSTSHLVNALNEFHSLNIDFISYTENVDTSTSIGKLTYTIFAAIADFERSLIRERVIAGINHARQKGKRLGRPNTIVNKSIIQRLHEQNRSIRYIARHENLSVGKVHAIIRELNPALEINSPLALIK